MDTVDVIDQAYREGVRGAYLAGIGAVVVQQAQRDRDEEDRATGAAFRRLVENCDTWSIDYECGACEVWLYDAGGDITAMGEGATLVDAVNAALGAEPGADA